jgi:protein SERAC1
MKDERLWPRDFLATDLENSRIMSFGYDSDIVHSDTAEVTQGSLKSDARSLCALLSAERNTSDSVYLYSH